MGAHAGGENGARWATTEWTTPSLDFFCIRRQEAEAWFASEDDSYLYSFVSICQALNLDTGGLRRALL